MQGNNVVYKYKNESNVNWQSSGVATDTIVQTACYHPGFDLTGRDSWFTTTFWILKNTFFVIKNIFTARSIDQIKKISGVIHGSVTFK